MRKVIVNEFMSLDGVVQAPGGAEEDASGGFGHGGWHLRYFDDLSQQRVLESIVEAGGFLLGRRTYEIFASYWPSAPAEEQVIAEPLNTKPKYVASTTLTEPLGSSVPPTDPAAFLGTFRTARAKGTFAGIELGYAFKTQGLATSDLGSAELGFEQNGVLDFARLAAAGRGATHRTWCEADRACFGGGDARARGCRLWRRRGWAERARVRWIGRLGR
ncbi:MAG: dihydrofolate reductase family protein [Gaiellaceae bacterium]